MAGDTTGMKQAQNQDKWYVKAAQKVGAGYKRASRHLPFAMSRREEIAKNTAMAAERARIEVQQEHGVLPTGGETQQDGGQKMAPRPLGRVPKGPDEEAYGEGELNRFAVRLREEIRRGQSRVAEVDTSDSVLREVVCHPVFIDQIRDVKALQTPREQSDEAYAEDMVKVRTDKERGGLAEQLEAREIGNLNSHEMDILLTTMVGSKYKKAKDDGSKKKRVAVELFWNPEDFKGLPTPPEALLEFLESIAHLEAPGREGEFIGRVLKQLASSKTIGEYNGQTPTRLMDSAHAEDYLSKRSAAPIEETVADFGAIVRDILATMTSEMHKETGVPGLGELKPAASKKYLEKRAALEKSRKDLEGAKELARNMDNDLQGKILLRDELAAARAGADAIRDAESSIEAAELAVQDAIKNVRKKEIERKRAFADFAPWEGMLRKASKRAEDIFRHSLLEVMEVNQFKDLPGKMKHKENMAVTDLLGEVNKLLNERKELFNAADKVLEYEAVEEGKSRRKHKDVAEKELKQQNEDLRRSSEKLTKRVVDSELPREVKEEIKKIVEAAANLDVLPNFVEHKMNEVAEEYAFPLKEAAKVAIKRLFSRLAARGEISDTQWMIARTIWEASGGKIEETPLKKEGTWDRITQFFVRWCLTLYGVKKILGIAYTISTMRKLVTNLFTKKRHLPVLYKLPKGALDPKKREVKLFGRWTMRYKHLGIAHLLATLYVAGTLVVANLNPPNKRDWYGFLQHYTATVPRGEFGWDGHSRWFQPWTWVKPVTLPQTFTRVLADPYDIPNLLADRSHDYYRTAYGVQNQANLEWLENNEDVLRFFQERRTLVKVRRARRLRMDTPETCSTPNAHIPPACKANYFNIQTEEDVANYDKGPVDTSDGWQPGKNMKVCCLTEMEWESIPDNLKLNRSTSDAFVEYMRRQQTENAEITYEWLTSIDNMMRWTSKRYLVDRAHDEAMTRFGISKVESVEFAVANKEHVTRLLLPYCKAGEAERFVKESNREDFMGAWMGEITSAEKGVDPRLDTIREETMDSTFKTVVERAEKAGWLRNTETTFRENKLAQHMKALNLTSEDARDIFIANEDIQQLLLAFTKTGAAYRVNTGRTEELIRFLQREKSKRTRMEEYNPFEKGRRAQALLNAGLIMTADEYRSTKATKAGGTSEQEAQRDAEAEQFYQDERHQSFSQYIDALLTGMREGEDAQARLMREAFGGNTEAANRAIKTEIHRLITSTDEADAGIRQRCSIDVTGAGETMQIQYNARRARAGLRQYIYRFVRRSGSRSE